MGVTIAQLSARLRCAECGGQLHSVKPWRLQDVLGKSLGRRGWTPLGNLHLWASPCFCSTASVEAFATPCLGSSRSWTRYTPPSSRLVSAHDLRRGLCSVGHTRLFSMSEANQLRRE